MEFIGMIYKFLFRLMLESAWRAVEKFQFVNWENTPGIINENGNHFEKKRWKIFFFYFLTVVSSLQSFVVYFFDLEKRKILIQKSRNL